MKADNFIAFFTACGFFIGVMFVIIKIQDPVEIVVYTLLITFFFYLVIHLAIMNYIKVSKQTFNIFFNKEKHEEINERLIAELSMRERKMENILSKLSSQKLKAKTLDKKHGRKAAKKAA
ncbi:Motility integral membrane protein [Campylobacter sputorum subsp. bubulus]|uniref:Motility integral membrane protein n=1 Tax=Campylobacter sputorum subsp. sputorum TaxID=32024 RepID=A0A381DLG8_9BACT|nr:hypothetical protein [Campylobacter sputorum]ASM34798.1 putative membrane protein [Campylobacter sputorum aubsp. sputorum RM3237]KAB0581646.1 hypothetical protein F7P64_05125 [Campylobacter sputorum subsp. sputorum]QEL04991.1 putative membrane protein [Campylobacter sputorum subsp. sputorum]SUX10142.1 Motility integral membrane protein [Campylobacter sputorum subsp. bubulus]SUX11478.1 Motility integral membrane protein [Campylobacter sputorum subsp. sputorum]